MFDDIDRAYYSRRAREARERAESAAQPSIANLHRRFAEEYERKAKVCEDAVKADLRWTRAGSELAEA
jgi:hypothetical protein